MQALGLSLDQAFIQARRFPPDMQRDIATAVHAYRTYKQRKDEICRFEMRLAHERTQRLAGAQPAHTGDGERHIGSV